MKVRRSNYKFFISLTIFSLIIAILSLGVSYSMPKIEITYAWPFVLLFLYIVTLVAYHILANYISSKLSAFANAFMLVNFGRLLFFSVIIVVYSYLNHSDAISFTITFFIYYLLLTTYEIVAVFRLQKRK